MTHRRFAFFFLALMAPVFTFAQDEPDTSLSVRPFSMSKLELQIWNSPDFQKRFAESYIAESEVEPQITIDDRDKMLKALELIQADKMDEAAAMLQKELEKNPGGSAVFDFTLANIYFQKETFDEAVACYSKATEKYPKFLRAWRNLGVIYVRQGDFAKATPALIRVLELGGGDSITYGTLGYAYSMADNSLGAETAYRMALMLDPETMDWKMGLARSLFRQERYAEAVALCGRLIDAEPDRSEFWLLQANAYIGLNETLKAAENFEIVDGLGKSTPESLNTLGDIYINESVYDLAVKAYSRAMETDQKGNSARAIRAAKALAARAAHEQTRQLLDKIQSLYGDNLSAEETKDILKLRARVAVAEGADDEEARVLKQIVELNPLDGEALILLGQSSARSGDTEQAIFYYERAEGLEKFEADAKVRHAQLLVREGNYTEALPLLRRAQQIDARENVQDYLEQVERVAKIR